MVRVLRPHGAPAEWRRSGCGWRVEAIHELDEHVLEAGLVVVGVLPDERDHLAIAVGSLTVVATGLIDHAEAIVAVVHVGEPHQEIAGSLLGLVELAGTDEFGGGVGRDGQFVLVSVLGAGEPRRNGGSHLTKVQGSLRPGLAIVVSIFAPRRTPPCTETCWLTPSSMNCCSPMIATLPTPHGARVARGAAALFIPLRIGASRVAGPAALGASTTGASASAAQSMAVDHGRRRRRCASSAPRSTSPRSWC